MRIVEIQFDNIMQADECHRAVHNTDGIEIVEKLDVWYKIKGSTESFNSLVERLDFQESEENRYEQYEFAEANRNAKKIVEKAI